MCGESLDIHQVSELYEALGELFGDKKEIEIEAKKVSRVDTAGLQLFIAFQKKLSESGGKLLWRQPSDNLLKSAHLLGVEVWIGLDSN
nr:STAS domain-containing protein [Marinibactrum halimedae]